MKKAILLSTLSMLVSSAALANNAISNSPEGARLYVISPQDGQQVSKTFKVQFGLSGMGVAPAGIDVKNTGHHHLLIDTDVSTVDLKKPLPSTDNIKHFGGGQTETELTLPEGKHTIRLVLGDHAHVPHDRPVMSEEITVTVK